MHFFVWFLVDGCCFCRISDPMGCLKDNSVVSMNNRNFETITQEKSFAQAFNNTCDISLSQLPSPCIKWDLVSMQILENVYLVDLEECKNHLHRITLAKGDKPLSHIKFYKMLWFSIIHLLQIRNKLLMVMVVMVLVRMSLLF